MTPFVANWQQTSGDSGNVKYFKSHRAVQHLASIMVRYTLFAGVTLMVCVPALHADQLWDWSLEGSQWSGSGTFETESTLTTGVSGFTGYRIVDISGTWNSEPITSLLPLTGFLSNDNLLAVSAPQLSLGGVSFENADTIYNIAYSGSLNNYVATSQNPLFTDDGRDTFSAAEVAPEPATTGLIGGTLLALALFVRLRFSGFVNR